jgi:hypothetical protein
MQQDATEISAEFPLEMRCPRCLYALGGQVDPICPECGTKLTPDDVKQFHAARAFEAKLPRLVGTRLAFGIAISITYSLGALAMCFFTTPRDQLPFAGIMGFLAPFLAVNGSIVTGYLWSRFAHPRDRRLSFAIWLKWLPWLHGPWLVAPIVAGTLLTTALFSKQEPDAMLALMLALLAIPWLVGTIVNLIRVMKRERQEMRDTGAAKRLPMFTLVLITLFITGGAMLTGMVAAIYSGGCAHRLMRMQR